MKIVQVTHSFLPFSVGGREEYVLNLCKELSKRHEVVLYTTIESSLPLVRRDDDVRIIYLPAKKIKIGHSFYRIPFTLFHFLMKENFDIIHAHDFFHFTTLISALVARIKKKPLVVTEHGYHIQGSYQRVLAWAYTKSLVRFIANTAKKVLVTSNYMKKEIIKNFHIDKRKIFVIHPGINTKLFKSKRGKGYILFVGRIVREKGLHLLIKALRKERLIVVGPIEEEEYFKRLKKLAEGKNVEFKHKVSKDILINFLSKCDFVVIPSLYEPFGIVALEAMASGKPVLAARTGGLKEIIDKDAGLFFQKGNIKDLRKKIEQMKKRKFNARKIRKIAERFDRKIFSYKIERMLLLLI